MFAIFNYVSLYPLTLSITLEGKNQITHQLIMPYREKEIQKVFYSIGDVAKMFNVNTSLIRFYENEFEILRPAKNKKGNRYFTPKDIENFKVIFHLVKDLGFTLEGAKKKLSEDKTGMATELEVKETLTRLREYLVQLKEKL